MIIESTMERIQAWKDTQPWGESHVADMAIQTLNAMLQILASQRQALERLVRERPDVDWAAKMALTHYRDAFNELAGEIDHLFFG